MLQYPNKILNTSIGNILKYNYQYCFSQNTLQYQYSIEILNYFPVSLSVFQKKFRGPKFENFIFLKIYHFRKFIVINFFHVNYQISDQKYQIVYIIEQNVIYALDK